MHSSVLEGSPIFERCFAMSGLLGSFVLNQLLVMFSGYHLLFHFRTVSVGQEFSITFVGLVQWTLQEE